MPRRGWLRSGQCRPLPSKARDIAFAAAALFAQSAGYSYTVEGTWRQRTNKLRDAFEGYMNDESPFFASVSSSQGDAFRLGPKWAFRAKTPLRLGLLAD